MDLTGSLVDTNLRLYPSEKLLNFIKCMPLVDDAPEHIQSLIETEKVEKKAKLNEKKHKLSQTGQLTDKDIANLSKIKETVKKQGKEINKPDKPLIGIEKDQQKDEEADTTNKSSEETNEEVQKEREGPYLFTSDIDWLYAHLEKRRKHEKDIPYLHELFEGTEIEMPKNQIIKRNPVLEARCVKLRAQQEARMYRKMTRGVDNVRMRYPEDSINYQLKQVNRQLVAIGQFIISIFAGFLFGFRGIEWMVGNLDFGFRLLLGVMCALVIALAEIYFLAKKLNEELNAVNPEQIGGPPKFPDQQKHGYEASSTNASATNASATNASGKEKAD